jgi:hypothetical protein
MNTNNISLSPGLWVGLMLPPITWAVQMQLMYVLVRFECSLGTKLAMLVIVAVALAMMLAAFLSALVNYHVPTFDGAELTVSRKKFMAALGLLSASIFFLVTLAQGIAVLVFHPCQL